MEKKEKNTNETLFVFGCGQKSVYFPELNAKTKCNDTVEKSANKSEKYEIKHKILCKRLIR